MNYDYLVNWTLKANYVCNNFHDSSLTLFELIFIVDFLLVTGNCFTNCTMQLVLKSDMHRFVYNELLYEF